MSPQQANVKAVCLGLEFDNNSKNLNCENTPYKYMYRCVSDVLECCKDLDNEWISILGVIATRRYHNSSSWEQYVAAVLGSFVTKVLQDDQVFAVLGGEGPEPREHSSLSCFPEQESVSLTGRVHRGMRRKASMLHLG